MSKCIEILNVSLKKNKHEVILDNISMNLNFGEVLTIIGPNGGGKTSLLRVLLGLEKKYFGQVNVSTKNIGYMPQKNFISNNFPIKVRKFLSLFEKKKSGDCDSKWIRLFDFVENADIESFGNSEKYESSKCVKAAKCSKNFEKVNRFENCSIFDSCRKFDSKKSDSKIVSCSTFSDARAFDSRISDNNEMHSDFETFNSDFETLNDIYTSFFRKNEIYNKKDAKNKRSDSSNEIIDLIMKFVKIENLQNKCLTELSLGELQKVLFASAIINCPSLLILDEPTNGLDLNSQSHFFNMINIMNKFFETTVIIVSHDLHNVLANSTKVVCMNKNIQCFGSPAEICKFCDGVAHYNHSHHSHKHN